MAWRFRRAWAATAGVVGVLAALAGRSDAPRSTPLFDANLFPGRAGVVFAEGAEMTLYRLDPGVLVLTAPNQPPPEKLQEYLVLAKVNVPDPAHRGEVRERLLRSLHADGFGLNCFDPHHGIRVRRGGETLDLVICFHCGNLQSFYQGREGGWGHTDRELAVVLERLLPPLPPAPGR
jgi:hypothetical protein